MGLAESRKRVKLSHDPNNTKWTRDTGGFGHKIMTAQGWQPGDILGARNASHAEFHTTANASHIRVFVKDDNLGLGAKTGSGLAEGECTGLDVFQSLLGRLNGKNEDELMKEQRSREDLKRAIYTERRWGSVRFVNGGFLVGDKIQELIDNQEDQTRELRQSSSRMADEISKSGLSQDTKPYTSQRLDTKDKSSRKKRRKVGKDHERSLGMNSEERSKPGKCAVPVQEIPDNIRSAQLKKPKRKRKNTEKHREQSNASVSGEQDLNRKQTKKKLKNKLEGTATEPQPLKEDCGDTVDHSSISGPLLSISRSSTPQSPLKGRHAVRSRHIAQKRLSTLDTASLNQIFMIKQ